MIARLWFWWRTCTCGCDLETHVHYRKAGRVLDCGNCGMAACPIFTRAPFPWPGVTLWRR